MLSPHPIFGEVYLHSVQLAGVAVVFASKELGSAGPWGQGGHGEGAVPGWQSCSLL